MQERFDELVGESLGRASVAWSNLPTGTFDSDTCSCLAIDIVNYHESIVGHLRERIEALRGGMIAAMLEMGTSSLSHKILEDNLNNDNRSAVELWAK